MKYGLLITSPVSDHKNIGDYIQSLAAKQFLNDNYCYVEKEAISEFKAEEPVKVIMNAWYMWHPECWPPQACIKPLLTSMHISHLTANEMLANGGKEYLIEHGPVGCRDLDTKKILDEAGIPCYFSACLTLTLGETYRCPEERCGVLFVDPYIPSVRYVMDGKSVYYPMNVLKGFWFFMKHPRKIIKLVNEKDFFKARFRLLTYYNASMFYESYSTKFEDDILFSAEYLTHMVPVNKTDNQESLLKSAEELVKKYAKAKLVVTSRIHCGLPCIGLETPVLFVLNKEMESENNLFNAPGRFGGLIDFFHVLIYKKNSIISNNEIISQKLNLNNAENIRNKVNWKEYKNNLVSSIRTFLK